MIFLEHTFAICAYKKSKYLEECIQSLLKQKVKSNIIIATATPNDYIEKISKKYSIPLFIREGKPDIQDDWNFAYSMADSNYVTITHQDDIYDENYVSELRKVIDNERKQLIYFSDYREIKNGEIVKRTKNLKVKKLMLSPLNIKYFRDKKIVRKMILSFGSPICCPSVTYNKGLFKDKIFTSKMKCSLDWDTWYKLSNKEGQFVYINKPLIYHRIHEESETTNSIENNVRQSEDYEMFSKFWPRLIADKLSKAYSKSLDTNRM